MRLCDSRNVCRKGMWYVSGDQRIPSPSRRCRRRHSSSGRTTAAVAEHSSRTQNHLRRISTSFAHAREIGQQPPPGTGPALRQPKKTVGSDPHPSDPDAARVLPSRRALLAPRQCRLIAPYPRVRDWPSTVGDNVVVEPSAADGEVFDGERSIASYKVPVGASSRRLASRIFIFKSCDLERLTSKIL
jgi:hypothetical protein